MSDKDSANVSQEQEVPTSQVSGGQTDKPSGQTSIDPLTFLENPDFQEGVRRLFQSEKDKGVARVQKELGGLKEEFARIAEKLNLKPEQIAQAQREIEIEDMVDWYRGQKGQPLASSQPAPGRDEVDMDGSVKAILAAYGIPANDPGVRAALSQVTGQQALEVAARYAANLKSKSPASASGIAAPMPSMNAKENAYPGVDSDDLIKRVGELQKHDPLGSVDERKKIYDELERRGEL